MSDNQKSLDERLREALIKNSPSARIKQHQEIADAVDRKNKELPQKLRKDTSKYRESIELAVEINAKKLDGKLSLILKDVEIELTRLTMPPAAVVDAGLKSIEGTARGGKETAKHKTACSKKIVAAMKKYLDKVPNVSAAARAVFKDGLGTSAVANQQIWTRYNKRKKVYTPLVLSQTVVSYFCLRRFSWEI